MALRPALFEALGFRVVVVRACGFVAALRWHGGGSMRRRWGLVEVDDGGARCPAVQLVRRGMRPSTKARMDWHGALAGQVQLDLGFQSRRRARRA